MTEQATGSKASEGQEQAKIDLSNYVPKEEYNKLNQSIEGLKKTLEEEKMKLLDQDYIEFLEAKRSKKVTQVDVDKAKAAGMPAEVVNYIEELRGRVVKTETMLANVAAVLELQETEKRFSDFSEYREDIQKILEADPTGSLSYEKAYLMAKGSKAGSVPKTGDQASKGSEKPGQFLPPSDSKREFKNTYEASQDAANQVRMKYNLSGDII